MIFPLMENSKKSWRRHREQSSLASPSSRRRLKMKIDEEFSENRGSVGGKSSAASHQDLIRKVSAQVEILGSVYSDADQDLASVKRAIYVLSELAKNEDMVNVIVECAAVPVLVKHLEAPPQLGNEGEGGPRLYEHGVEKGSAFILGLLAIKPEHQQLIVDAGAIPHLVDLLKRHSDGPNSLVVSGVIRRVADAITNLAHENSSIKAHVRIEGGIPPIVHLLKFADAKVLRAAAGALCTLAFKNDENKNQIVERNALPALILMLQSEDTVIHYEAVGVIGNLVHSSPSIKKEVLVAGALQPVIGLFRYDQYHVRNYVLYWKLLSRNPCFACHLISVSSIFSKLSKELHKSSVVFCKICDCISLVIKTTNKIRNVINQKKWLRTVIACFP